MRGGRLFTVCCMFWNWHLLLQRCCLSMNWESLSPCKTFTAWMIILFDYATFELLLSFHAAPIVRLCKNRMGCAGGIGFVTCILLRVLFPSEYLLASHADVAYFRRVICSLPS